MVVEKLWTKLFSPERLEGRARLHPVGVLDRMLDIIALVRAPLLGFALVDSRSIEENRRSHARFADHPLEPSSIHD